MENAKYIFQISPYDTDKLLPQVSKALEKRTEIVSRERYPNLWKHTDKLNTTAQGQTGNRLRTKILSIICLLLGIFLFVPGLMKPEELAMPLLWGAIAIGTGIGGLWRSRKHKKNPFDKSAKQLLAGKESISEDKAVSVAFSEEGMTLPADNGSTELVPYSNFECSIETDDLFLLVYGERVTVLQKFDLTSDHLDGFRKLLSEKTGTVTV